MKHLKNELIAIARENIAQEDPSHDINHALRVLKNTEKIVEKEGGNYKILYPAALFHDIVKYLPQDKRDCALESAKKTEKILFDLPQYTLQDIQEVKKIILEHPFSKNITPTSIESKIIQDADKLEATGAISIMRTFCSTRTTRRASRLCAFRPLPWKRRPRTSVARLLYYSSGTLLTYTSLLCPALVRDLPVRVESLSQRQAG